ncbi:MAG: SHOCT domain-containing protein [Methanoregula sp.]|nr:SHOCT domain-containing protein [Methanoregula sp.]
MRGRGLMLVGGMAMGSRMASKQAAQAAVLKEQGAQGALQKQAATAPPAPAAQMADVTTQLQKLAELHKSGVLTDEEFAAAKKKIL